MELKWGFVRKVFAQSVSFTTKKTESNVLSSMKNWIPLVVISAQKNGQRKRFVSWSASHVTHLTTSILSGARSNKVKQQLREAWWVSLKTEQSCSELLSGSDTESAHLDYSNHAPRLRGVTFQAAKCRSAIISLRGKETRRAPRSGSNDVKMKSCRRYAPARFSISASAPVGGLIGLKRLTSRRWRSAEHDGRGVREEERRRGWWGIILKDRRK